MGDRITILAIPRDFAGDVGQRQRNAVQSWLLSGYDVLLCGDDPGVVEYATEMEVGSLPVVARNEWGTPLLNDLFAQAQARLAGRLVAYVNADILLDSSLGAAIELAAGKFASFLVVGRRYDAHVYGAFDFSGDWRGHLRVMAAPERQHGEFGLDFFGFRAPLWGNIPPLAVGRMRWDNWLLHAATAQGTETIDASLTVLAVHQEHGYEHIPARPGGAEWYANPEIARNLALAGPCVIGTNSTRWLLRGQEIVAR